MMMLLFTDRTVGEESSTGSLTGCDFTAPASQHIKRVKRVLIRSLGCPCRELATVVEASNYPMPLFGYLGCPSCINGCSACALAKRPWLSEAKWGAREP
eukprot:scaffold157285_cov22-Prasinocladus_malaysianus.AAC.1